jgi:hypothetical protein
MENKIEWFVLINFVFYYVITWLFYINSIIITFSDCKYQFFVLHIKNKKMQL